MGMHDRGVVLRTGGFVGSKHSVVAPFNLVLEVVPFRHTTNPILVYVGPREGARPF